MKGGRGERGHGDGWEQRVEPSARKHHLCPVLMGWPWAKLTNTWRTVRKNAFKVKYRQAMWEGERHDGMCDWDMCVVRVMNLNIGRRWGKSRGSARQGLIAPVRRRRQFYPNVFVPNVWVQCLVFLQSLVCRGCDLNWPSRVTGMFVQIECGAIIPPGPVCLLRRPIKGISSNSNHWIAEVHHVAMIAFVSMLWGTDRTTSLHQSGHSL